MSLSEINPLTEAIQLAVAPVFLLTGVAGMLNALGTRLARVIDRARRLHELVEASPAPHEARLRGHLEELQSLHLRSRVINWATALMVICAVLIGLTVMELFYAAGIAGRLQLTRHVDSHPLGRTEGVSSRQDCVPEVNGSSEHTRGGQGILLGLRIDGALLHQGLLG